MNVEYRSQCQRAMVVVACVLLWTAVSAAADFDKKPEFEPVYIQDLAAASVRSEDLKPGLASLYYLKFFERDVRLLPATERSRYPSFRGQPILKIDHQFNDDKVFESGSNRGVGLRMTGYLQFEMSGVYRMQALSNDGIIVRISDVVAISDPEQHSDRLSNVAHITIEETGWYPVRIDYFQRKGTAALKLFWASPGTENFIPIPEKAYAHQERPSE